MSKPGNYTAYQQYRPIEDKTTQTLQNWSLFFEQKKQNDIAQEQKKDEFNFKIEKDIQEEKDKWLTFPKLDTTGVADVDQFFGAAVQTINQERVKIVGEMENYKRNSPGWTKNFIKLKKLNLFPEKFKTITNQQLQDAQTYAKEKGKTKVATAENDNAFSNLRNPDIRLNPETMEIGFVVKDPNDETKTKVLTEQEMLNGGSAFKLIPLFDDNKWIQENIKLLNSKPPYYMDTDETTGKPVLKTGYDKEKAIRPYVEKTLFIEGEPTEFGISFGAQLGYTEKQLKDKKTQDGMVAHYTDRLYPALTGGVKLDKDSESLRITEEKNKETAEYQQGKLAVDQKNANTKVEVETGKGNLSTPLTTSSFKYGGKDKNGNAVFAVEKNNLIIQNKKENTLEVVENLYANPNKPNSVIVEGYTVTEDEDGVQTRTPFKYLNKEDVLRFASQANMDIKEMYKTLMGVAKLKPATTKAKPKAKETLEERKKRLLLK